MSTAPSLNGQVLGQAERATRALLDRVLRRTGTSFPQWVALNALATTAPVLDRAGLVEAVVGGLKVAAVAVEATIDQLTAAGLIQVSGARIDLTAAGLARQAEIRAAIAEITARLYGGIPPEELATAGRVLTLVTQRANDALAA